MSRSGRYLALLALAAVACLLGVLLIAWHGAPASPAPRYILRDNGGHPALYAADGSGPLACYEDIYTRLLPESDYLTLQQGLPIADEAELQQRLEDLGL